MTQPTTRTRVLIVTDHSFVSQTIELALERTDGLGVVGAADGSRSVRSELLELAPDVIVVDDMHGADAALARLREAAALAPDAVRVLLTLDMDDEWLGDAFDAGATAAISKTVHAAALGTLLRETARSNVVQPQRRVRSQSGDSPLTSREAEILALAAQGYTNGRIARELWLAERTVKFHLSNTYRKLGVANRTEASRYVLTLAPAAS